MADQLEMEATVRPRAGKGAARAVRREGRIPAVIYGDSKPPQSISLSARELTKQFLKGRFTSQIVDLVIDGKKNQVIPRDVQLDPVRDNPIHVDFLRVSATTAIQVEVPVEFINEDMSPGMKKGGALNVVRHGIEVSCAPGKIPESFVFDLAEAEIGDSLHLSDTTMPEGVTPVIDDRDFTIATITAPVLAVEDEPDAEADTDAEAAEGDAEAKSEEGGDDKGGDK